MRKLPTIICLYLLIIKSTISLGQKNSVPATFYSFGYYFGVALTLKPDMSFTLKYHGHISSDTAAGNYIIVGDTIFLNYIYNNYDSIYAAYKAQNKVVPIDIQLDASRVFLRPKIVIKKRLNLYVVDEDTRKIKTYEKSGRRYTVYFKKRN